MKRAGSGGPALGIRQRSDPRCVRRARTARRPRRAGWSGSAERKGRAIFVDYEQQAGCARQGRRCRRLGLTPGARLVSWCSAAGGDRDCRQSNASVMARSRRKMPTQRHRQDDNPRSGKSGTETIRAAILGDAKGAGNPATADEAAIRTAIFSGAVAAGDAIGIAGQGHETGTDYRRQTRASSALTTGGRRLAPGSH